MSNPPQLTSEDKRRAKRLEAVLTAAAETARGLEVLQPVRNLPSARGFTDELIRLGGDPGRLTFDLEAATGRKQLSALDLLASDANGVAMRQDAVDLPDDQPLLANNAPLESQTLGALGDLVRSSTKTEREIVDVLIAWADAYGDVEGMDKVDTDLYEALIAIRKDLPEAH